MTQVVKAPDGRRLSVESLGDPEGKSVFLLHGTPGGYNGPHPRGIVLHRRAIRLISYDRPGYPGSDRIPERSVADAETIADYLRIDRFSVVGRSGRAPHALAFAAIMTQWPRSSRGAREEVGSLYWPVKMGQDATPEKSPGWRHRRAVIHCFIHSNLFLAPRSRQIEPLFAEYRPCSG